MKLRYAFALLTALLAAAIRTGRGLIHSAGRLCSDVLRSRTPLTR